MTLLAPVYHVLYVVRLAVPRLLSGAGCARCTTSELSVAAEYSQMAAL